MSEAFPYTGVLPCPEVQTPPRFSWVRPGVATEQRYWWVVKRRRLVKLQSAEVEQALQFQEWLWNSAVELKHANRDQSLPPNPVACPGGMAGVGVLITTLYLFDPPDSMAVRPQVNEATAVRWWLWLMVQMPPLTQCNRPGKAPSSHVTLAVDSEGKHSSLHLNLERSFDWNDERFCYFIEKLFYVMAFPLVARGLIQVKKKQR